VEPGYAAYYRHLYQHHWWWRARERIILAHLQRLKPPGGFGPILDVGCGQGSLLADLLAEFPSVTPYGTDVSQSGLDLARQKADQLVSKDMVVQEGQRRADQLLVQARAEADTIRADADDYVIDSLTQLQAELERISNQVNNGIRSVRDDQARRTPASSPVSQPVDKE